MVQLRPSPDTRKAGVFGAISGIYPGGFAVRAQAAGVGRATTRAVVLSISYLVVADMLFTYFLNR